MDNGLAEWNWLLSYVLANVDYKSEFCQELKSFFFFFLPPNCKKWLQASLKCCSIQESHLKSCVSIRNRSTQTILVIWKGADSFFFFRFVFFLFFLHLSRNTGCEGKQKDLPLGWGDESVLSSRANPGCILSEAGCAPICCASGFRYSSLQTHRQLTANTAPHPRCSSAVRLPPVLSAPEPQPVIYYLAVFCLTRVHTVGRAVAFVAGYLCHICNSVLSGAHDVVSPQHSSEDARIGCCGSSPNNNNQGWMWQIAYFCTPLETWLQLMNQM